MIRHALPHRSLAGVLLLAAVAGLAPRAAAHDMTETRIVLVLRADGAFHAEVGADLDAMALGADPTVDSVTLADRLRELDGDELDSLVERLRRTFERRMRIFADGERVPFEVTFPARGRAPRSGEPPTVLGLVARLDGRLPAGTETVSVRASRAFPPVELVVLREHDEEPIAVEQGTPSPAVLLVPEARWATSALGWSAGESAALAGVRALVGLGVGHLLLLLAAALAPPALGRAAVGAALVGLGVATAGAAAGGLALPAASALPAAAITILLGGLGATWLAWRWAAGSSRPSRPWWLGAWSLAGLVHGAILGRRVVELGRAGPPPEGAATAFTLGALAAAAALAALAVLVGEHLWRRSSRAVAVVAAGVGLVAALGLPATVSPPPADAATFAEEDSTEPPGETRKPLNNGRFTLFLQPIENPRRIVPSS